MKILFWTEWFRPHIGGIEVLGGHLIRALGARGYKFSVITSQVNDSLPAEEMSDGVTVYRLPFQRVLNEQNLLEIRSLIQRVAAIKASVCPDLVHVNSFGATGFFHERTAGIAPAPVLVTFHGEAPLPSHLSPADALLGRMFISANWIAAVSKATLEDLLAFMPEIATRSSVIYHTLEPPDLPPVPLPREAPIILCLGRVVREKGFDVAIDAFVQLVSRFPRARLVIAGGGRERAALERQVAEQDLTGSVEFIGWVVPERIPALINSATLVAVPSRWREPFPLVAVQAAQMGRPVVSTCVGGIPELLVDRATGLLVEKDDVTGMAEAFAWLIENPDAAARMGLEASRRAREVFGWGQCVNAYDRLYRQIS